MRRADSRPVWKGSNMDIILSNSSGKPIYEQIADQVKEQIPVSYTHLAWSSCRTMATL